MADRCFFIKKIMFQGNLPRRNIEQISINNVKSKAETSLQSEQIKFLKFCFVDHAKTKMECLREWGKDCLSLVFIYSHADDRFHKIVGNF